MSPKRPAKPQLDLFLGIGKSAFAKATVDTKMELPEQTETAIETPDPKTPSRNLPGRTWQVRQLVSEARELVEHEFGNIWVEGEISNYRPASSGHLYFTLKDAEAQLPVVLFRRQAQMLRFRPDDGLHVRVRGKVTIYEQRGQIQLVAETMEPVGTGSLQLAFEQLRDQLKAEGLFEQERKRPLPAYPRTVAVITSPTGAVIRDFLNIVSRRHSGLNVLLIPVNVQGDAAPMEIEAALVRANSLSLSDVIVLARGGGSLEDLAAFNNERVARAIAASEIPVVSAVGHETDFTIADFVADLRAPTPSAAAELITEAQHRISDYLVTLSQRMERGIRFHLLEVRQRLARVAVSRTEQRMMTTLHRQEQRLDDLAFRMESAIGERLRDHQHTVSELCAAVLRHDPRRQLGTAREALSTLRSRLDHSLDRRLTTARHQIGSYEDRLYRSVPVHLASRRATFSTLRSQLHSLSPLAVLKRGYAVIQDESGKIIRTLNSLTAGQLVSTRLNDGTFTSRVETASSKDNKKEQ